MNENCAIITPSFRGDFVRCQLLVESIQRFVPDHVKHYLVVDRRDMSIFHPLQSNRTRLLVVEELLPWWIMRLPRLRRFWWSFRSLPIRNWILQQIVKLSVPHVVPEEYLFYVDSDVFFVRPFDPSDLIRNGQAPLFCETGKSSFGSFNDEWHAVAARIIGIPVETNYDTIFVGNIVCWRKSLVKRLSERIEAVSNRHWVLSVVRHLKFSEYVLYGMFVTRLAIDEPPLHYRDSGNGALCLCYWGNSPLGDDALADFKAQLAETNVAVMISAKSKTDVGQIRRVFGSPA